MYNLEMTDLKSKNTKNSNKTSKSGGSRKERPIKEINWDKFNRNQLISIIEIFRRCYKRSNVEVPIDELKEEE